MPPPPPPSARAHRIASLVFGVAGMILVAAFLLSRPWHGGGMLIGFGIASCVRSLWHLVRSRQSQE